MWWGIDRNGISFLHGSLRTLPLRGKSPSCTTNLTCLHCRVIQRQELFPCNGNVGRKSPSFSLFTLLLRTPSFLMNDTYRFSISSMVVMVMNAHTSLGQEEKELWPIQDVKMKMNFCADQRTGWMIILREIHNDFYQGKEITTTTITTTSTTTKVICKNTCDVINSPFHNLKRNLFYHFST